jgi:hypothetical protein
VIVRVNNGLPWIRVSTNITRERLWGLLNFDSRLLPFGTDHIWYFDQVSSALSNGKEVVAEGVRGVDDGKRVFFLDVCIRDVQ